MNVQLFIDCLNMYIYIIYNNDNKRYERTTVIMIPLLNIQKYVKNSWFTYSRFSIVCLTFLYLPTKNTQVIEVGITALIFCIPLHEIVRVLLSSSLLLIGLISSFFHILNIIHFLLNLTEGKWSTTKCVSYFLRYTIYVQYSKVEKTQNIYRVKVAPDMKPSKSNHFGDGITRKWWGVTL